ncbi:uncharacterized protein BT62DRAFT_1013027 [Guyanagaster necrorhizus]|uniref:Uncharacterized protein n=1 Tax=Guyanagaster necrorhizus TaxID=856835 RepID=A0A9P7VFR5_9AGAR|nr:uncharacterized protein BT62DRAFT_1013027 [Guyanagaster necrorhizus MCA 3950]KAG7440116.1 hypothetical protein BT62DRAFT_1013027 [Guyanagaster necrorhizus MCA 3950]
MRVDRLAALVPLREAKRGGGLGRVNGHAYAHRTRMSAGLLAVFTYTQNPPTTRSLFPPSVLSFSTRDVSGTLFHLRELRISAMAPSMSTPAPVDSNTCPWLFTIEAHKHLNVSNLGRFIWRSSIFILGVESIDGLPIPLKFDALLVDVRTSNLGQRRFFSLPSRIDSCGRHYAFFPMDQDELFGLGSAPRHLDPQRGGVNAPEIGAGARVVFKWNVPPGRLRGSIDSALAYRGACMSLR